VLRDTRRFCCQIAVAAAGWLALGGCASLYFEDAGRPPDPPPRFSLDRLPWQDYWTGIVFNGEKIGFSHTRVAPVTQSSEFEIQSEAAFLLRFLGVQKKFQMRSVDRVRGDLQLVRFEHDYDIDGVRQQVSGEVRDRTLQTTIETRGNTTHETLPLATPLYPTAVIGLFPIHAGLAVGRTYRYLAYSGETQNVSAVVQEVLAYERSELFEGPAFHIKTDYQGQSSTTWLSAQGLPVFELSLNGVLISALEDEHRARAYLAAASLNKSDMILDFSRIPLDRPIEKPREKTALTLAIDGLDSRFLLPPSAQQRCTEERGRFVCVLRRIAPGDGGARASPPPRPGDLGMSVAVPSHHPRIAQLAREITPRTDRRSDQVRAIVAWIRQHIEQSPTDVFSALDVLDAGKAECQGHSFLYAALARSLGIPTRVVNGIVYSDDYNGFYYHTWTESLLDDGWIAIDPTFGQIGADATHVKLIEGETPADLLPLVDLVGRLKAEHARP